MGAQSSAQTVSLHAMLQKTLPNGQKMFVKDTTGYIRNRKEWLLSSEAEKSLGIYPSLLAKLREAKKVRSVVLSKEDKPGYRGMPPNLYYLPDLKKFRLFHAQRVKQETAEKLKKVLAAFPNGKALVPAAKMCLHRTSQKQTTYVEEFLSSLPVMVESLNRTLGPKQAPAALRVIASIKRPEKERPARRSYLPSRPSKEDWKMISKNVSECCYAISNNIPILFRIGLEDLDFEEKTASVRNAVFQKTYSANGKTHVFSVELSEPFSISFRLDRQQTSIGKIILNGAPETLKAEARSVKLLLEHLELQASVSKFSEGLGDRFADSMETKEKKGAVPEYSRSIFRSPGFR